MKLTHEGYERRLGFILAFGALIWGGTYNAFAKGLTPFLSPVTLLILSEALTAAFIVMTFGLVPLLKELIKMDAKSIRMAAIIGLLNSAVAPLLWFTGLSYTSAINASILSASDIIAVLILGRMLLGETISRMQAVGLATIMGGILVVNLSSGQTMSFHVGDLLIVTGSFISGAGSILFKRYISHVMPELAIAIRNISGIAAVGFVSIFFHQQSIIAEVAAFPVQKVILLLSFAFFSRYLCLAFFYEGIDRLPATTFSMIQVATPLSGLVFAFLILGEQIHSYQILGCIFIILGLLLEQCSPKALHSIRSRIKLPRFWHHKERMPNLTLLPKNI